MSGSAPARHHLPRLIVCIGALAVSVPHSARAQGSHQVAAEALFREARKLVDDGRFAEACEKFAASQKLESAVGTLLNLGRCYEKIERPASAWATYHEAIAVANATGQLEREKIARERADSLEPTLPRLTISVSTQTAGTQLSVKRDGEAVLPEVWGVTVPVDPGEHVVEAGAPGRKPWSSKTVAEARRTATLVVPALDVDETAVASSSSAPAPGDGSEPQTSPSGDWNGKKTAAIVLAGVGVAGVVLATVEGLRVLAKNSDYDQFCLGGTCKEPNYSIAKGIRSDAEQARTLSIVSGVAGGACLIGAAVFWFTSGRSAATANGKLHVSPIVGSGRTGLELEGSF